MQQADAKTSRNQKSRLKPVKVDGEKRVIPKGDSRKPRWWRVSIGKRFTGTNKQRRFFDTEAEATEFIRDTEQAMRQRGKSAFEIPRALAVEATELSKKLAPHGVSLTEAVNFFLRNAPITGKKTVTQLIPEYLRTKTDAEYRKAQAISLGVFERDFGKKPVPSIFAPELERWFAAKRWNPLNARNYMRDLSMFFRWAEFRDYATGNPFDKIKRPKVERKAAEIFTLKEARQILEAAYKNPDLGLLPMYAVGFFSGVRIEEIGRMTWEMIDWKEGEIRLPGSITKTGMPRNIEIIEALRSAIEKDAPKKGEIVLSKNLRLRRDKLVSLAKVSKKRNALRHSFASYHAAKHRDPGALQHLLGQETPSVLYKHYINATRKADAEAFFNLRAPYEPPKGEEEDAHPFLYRKFSNFKL